MRTRKRSAAHELQNIVQLYRESAGEIDVDMNVVAAWAIKNLGVVVKPPKTETERLAQNLARAARQQTKRDERTGRPYRVNHAYPAVRYGEQTMLWTDIDSAGRGPMLLSFQQRRNQMIGEADQLFLDNEHWTAVNPDQEPIVIKYDFTEDIAERRAAADIDDENATDDELDDGDDE